MTTTRRRMLLSGLALPAMLPRPALAQAFPTRPVTWVASVGFFSFLPTVVKTGAMFHPEPLGMLVTAGAMLVLARMVRTRTYSWTLAVVLGLLLGAGQLVRAWSLWMVGVAVVVSGRPLRTRRSHRRRSRLWFSGALRRPESVRAPNTGK